MTGVEATTLGLAAALALGTIASRASVPPLAAAYLLTAAAVGFFLALLHWGQVAALVTPDRVAPNGLIDADGPQGGGDTGSAGWCSSAGKVSSGSIGRRPRVDARGLAAGLGSGPV